MSRRNESGNLLVILAVAAVVLLIGGAALLLPALKQARLSARKAMSSNNLRQIGLACEQFAGRQGDVMPTTLSQLNAGPAPVIGNLKTFTVNSTPGVDKDGRVITDYLFFTRYHNGLKRSDSVIASDKPGNFPGGGSILFGDWHVKWYNSPEYEKLLEQAKRESEAAKAEWPEFRKKLEAQIKAFKAELESAAESESE